MEGYVWKISMDEAEGKWKMKVKIKDGNENGRQGEYGRYVRKSGMDGTCPQCRVQVEKGKVNGWVSESERQWIHGTKMKGGLNHLGIWMHPLIFMFL